MWRDDFAEWESEQVVDFLFGAVNEDQCQIIVEILFYGKTLVGLGHENSICRSMIGAQYRSGLKQMRKLYTKEGYVIYCNK